MMLTLRDRLILVNVAIFLVALPLLALFIFNQVTTGLYTQFDRGLEIVAYSDLVLVEMVERQPQFEEDSHPSGQFGADGFIRLLDARGQITDGVGALYETPVLAQSLRTTAQGQVFNQTANNGTLLRVFTLPIEIENQRVGYIQVADDQDSIRATMAQVRSSLMLGAPLTILLSSLLSFVTIWQALRPLTRMTQAAAHISEDDLTQRLPLPAAKDELRNLALAFNDVLERLADAFTRQRRFTANASHELRTPVTAILGHAELALSRPRPAEAYQESLHRIQDEAERMQRLIRRMLALARAEAADQTLTLSEIDLAETVHTLVETFQPQAAAKGLTLSVDAPPTLPINTDLDSLTQILLNLLDNALTYTEQGSIGVTVQAQNNHAQITVRDTGQGIAAEHLPYLFQPFYRVDPARSRERGNVGLGLALTHELTRSLGGSLTVTSELGRGTAFVVTLPRSLG